MAVGEEVGDAYIAVHADTAPFRRELALMRKQLAKDSARMDATLGRVDRQLARLNTRMKNVRKTTESHGHSMTRLARAFERGHRASERFSKAIHRMNHRMTGSFRRMDSTVRLVIALIAVAGNMVAALGSGLSAGLVAITGAAVLAAAALAPLTALIAPFVLGLAAAVKGFSDLEKFAPGAASAMKALGKEFTDVAVPALMKEWGDSLEDFFGSLNKFLSADIFSAIGEAFSAITDSLAEVLDSDVGKNFAEALAGPLSAALATMGSALGPLLSTLLQFFTAAAPFAQILADRFLDWATNLEKAFGASVQSGAFQEFMDLAITALGSVMDLLGEVGDALMTVFQAGAPSGIVLIELITRMVENFDKWANSLEGQTALQEWFQNGIVIMDAVFKLLGDLGTALADLVTPHVIDQLVLFLAAVGDILPVLGEIISIIGEAGILEVLAAAIGAVGDVLTSATPALKSFFEILGGTLLDVLDILSPMFVLLGEAIGTIMTALEPIIPLLGTALIMAVQLLVPLIARLVEAFAPLVAKILPMLTSLFSGLWPVIVTLVDSFMQILDALMPVFEAMVAASSETLPLITELLTLFAEVLADVLVDAITAIAPLLVVLASSVEFLVPIFELLLPLLEIAGTSLGFILDGVLALLQPLLNFLGNTDRMTQGLARFKDMLRGVIDWVEAVKDSIQDWVKKINLTKWFENWWSLVETIGNNVVDWFRNMQKIVGQVFSNIAYAIESSFKRSFNRVADAWNNTVGSLSWTVPDWVPGLGGNTVSAPRIPHWYAAGGIATSPTIAGFGEAGAEALVPLDRPLSQVDPSVRALSAFAQGLGGSGTNISEGAIVIQTAATDGRVIAESVLDRIVAHSR